MNLNDLAEAVQEDLALSTGTVLSQKKVKQIIGFSLSRIKQNLIEGHPTKLTEFGTFSTKLYKHKIMPHPKKPHETLEIENHYIPKFTASKVFKRLVRESDVTNAKEKIAA